MEAQTLSDLLEQLALDLPRKQLAYHPAQERQ